LVLAKKEPKAKGERVRTAKPVPGLSEEDSDLFERLRKWRKATADEERVPAYVIFHDAALIALAQAQPKTHAELRAIPGIGEKKVASYGDRILEVIAGTNAEADEEEEEKAKPVPSVRKTQAFGMFARKAAIAEVMRSVGVAQSTAAGYLVDYIESDRPADVSIWVSDEIYREVLVAAQSVDSTKLKPVFEALEEKVPYDAIKIVLTHRRVTSEK